MSQIDAVASDNSLAYPTIPNATQPTAQPANPTPAENPLDQLRDIHLPEAIDQFPSAPGWWILLFILVCAIAFYLYRIYQYKKAIRLIKPAKAELAELKSLEENEVDSHAIALLTGLIKRVCLIFYPSHQVASLNGESWWQFVNSQHAIHVGLKKELYSQDEIIFLTQAPYRKETSIQTKHWHKLLKSSEDFIENLIKYSAKRNKRKGAK